MECIYHKEVGEDLDQSSIFWVAQNSFAPIIITTEVAYTKSAQDQSSHSAGSRECLASNTSTEETVCFLYAWYSSQSIHNRVMILKMCSLNQLYFRGVILTFFKGVKILCISYLLQMLVMIQLNHWKKKSVSYWASLGLIMCKHCYVLQFISTIKPYILMTYFNKAHYAQFF